MEYSHSELTALEHRLTAKLRELAKSGQQLSEDAVLSQSILKFVLFLVEQKLRDLRDSELRSVASRAEETICSNCKLKNPDATHCAHCLLQPILMIDMSRFIVKG